jgi:hypothetical protein
MNEDDDLDELASDQEPDDGKSGISGSCWACSLADTIHTALRDNWSRNAAMVIASHPLGKVNCVGRF